MNKLCKQVWMSLFLFPLSSFAYQNHYYVAANIGLFQGDFNLRYLDQTDVVTQNIAQLASQRGYNGCVAVGFKRECVPDYVVGAELSVSKDGHRASFQSGAATAAFSDTTKIQYHVDLLFVPGLKITECVTTYLKLGLSFASIQNHLTSPVGFTAVSTNYNSHRNRFGFAAGLGFARTITNTLSVFTEAAYHDYGSVNFPNFQNFTASYTHQAHVYSYNVVVGLAYQFA